MTKRLIRDEVLCAYEVGRMGMKWLFGTSVLGKPAISQPLWNAMARINYQSQQKRAVKGSKKVDIDKLVEKWKSTVVKLAIAHDRDEFDEAESSIEDLLTPILTAPIKQIREFVARLVAELKADKQVPMVVWGMFEAWAKVFIDPAEDQGIKRLKTRLARDIADLVEEDVKPQLMEAMVRALRWRSPEKLREIKQAVQQGGKVKVRGKESCLFMSVHDGQKKVAEVML
jgi:hypothetical protein